MPDSDIVLFAKNYSHSPLMVRSKLLLVLMRGRLWVKTLDYFLSAIRNYQVTVKRSNQYITHKTAPRPELMIHSILF